MISLARLATSLLIAGLLALLVPVYADAAPRMKRNHWPTSTVYVENHAGPRWPVAAAARNLDNGSGLHLIVVGQCPAGVSCIVVRSGSLPGDTVGRTSQRSSGSVTLSATVTVDDGWGSGVPKRWRKKLLCHEIGHAVGLEHSKSRRGTCMRVGYDRVKPTLSKSDRRALDRVY